MVPSSLSDGFLVEFKMNWDECDRVAACHEEDSESGSEDVWCKRCGAVTQSQREAGSSCQTGEPPPKDTIKDCY